MANDKITVSDYFLTRLQQLGVKKVYGVPGDFNLAFLDLVEDFEGLDWVGNCNELNAAYAADGYARVSEAGIGCVVTTFGVGELSAVNGIAGCHSERVPVIHLVGVPSTKLQAHHAVLHHTLGDGRFDAYTKIAENVTAAQSFLLNPSQAPSEIDRIIRSALRLARPVYLTLPTDLVHAEVDASALRKDLREEQLEVEEKEAEDEGKLRAVVDGIASLYEKAKSPIILVDACAIRFKVEKEALALVEATGAPVFVTPMGKTAIDESHPQFGGLYVGDVTVPSVKEVVEKADLTISIGTIASDFNTGSFTYHIRRDQHVELHSDSTVISHAHYPSMGFRKVLPSLTSALGKLAKRKPEPKIPDPELVVRAPRGSTAGGGHVVTQDEFWPLWGAFFRKGDVVLGETGTSSFGLMDVKFPDDAKFLTQVLYGSIGWTGGACLGAAQAAQEQGRRTILFIGDGSLQLTVQEISTMIRVGVKPILVVLDNDGYSIERFIHGMTRAYNDIALWKFTGLLEVFGGQSGKSYTANTRAELERILADPAFGKADRIQLLAVKLPKEDAPRALKKQAELTAQANAD